MDCLVQQPIWTGAYHHGGLTMHHHHPHHHPHFFSPYFFPKKRSTLPCSYYQASSFNLATKLDDDVVFSTDIKIESSDDCMLDDDKDVKICVVCGERASGYYFGALVCLPCKSFYIRCTKEGEPTFTCQCNGNCDIAKQGRIRCQYCRYQRCLMAGMCRKEKPETVQPAEGQVLCKVCGDIANGIHFGVNTCEGCKKFFRRGLVENQSYVCKGDKQCTINPRNRNNCRYCRYHKCITVGMSREAIKMGRPKKADSTDCFTSNSPVSGGSVGDLSSDDSNSSIPSSPRSTCSSISQKSTIEADPKSVDDPTYFMLSNKKIKTEQDNSCDTLPSKPQKMTMVSDLSYTQLTPITDSCSMGSNTDPLPRTNCSHSPSNQQVWNAPAAPVMSSWHRPSSHEASMSGRQQNPLSFIEDEMDEILDYLQTDQATRKQPPQQNYEYYSNQCSPSRSQCMVGQTGNFNMTAGQRFEQTPCQQSVPSDCNMHALSVDTSQTSPHGSPAPYPDSPVSTGHYPSSPCYSDTSAHSPQHYNPHSPVCSSPHYPNSPVQPSQFTQSSVHTTQYPHSPSHSTPYPNSPVTTTQYPNSSMSSTQYSSNSQFTNSPTHSTQYPASPCMYTESPAESSHQNNTGFSPRSSCQYSPSPVDNHQYSPVHKTEYNTSISISPNGSFNNTADNFSRAR